MQNVQNASDVTCVLFSHETAFFLRWVTSISLKTQGLGPLFESILLTNTNYTSNTRKYGFSQSQRSDQCKNCKAKHFTT